jgi:hypothetical protein
MKNIFTRFISGSLFIVLGLLAAIGPQTIFQPCLDVMEVCVDGMSNNVFMPMKCYWSAMAEIGPGGAIAILGLLLLCFRKSQMRLGIIFAQTLLGIMAILFPAKLIGICMSKTHDCHLLFYPMILVLGSLVIALSLVNGFFIIKKGLSDA